LEDKDIFGELVGESGRCSEKLGLPSVLGQVWGTLYFKGGMTQEQLKKELGIGLGSISQSIKTLEHLGFISSPKKEGRKRVYEANFSTEIISRFIENALRHEIQPMSSLLESRIPVISDKKLKHKADELNKSLNRTARLLKLFMSVKE
jgi:DNA-binding transcriptional regulator GbsR (MarR family)